MKNIIVLIAISLSLSGKGQTSQEMQYGAYLKTSKSMWERSIALAENESGSLSLQKAKAMYGLLNNTMATQDEDTFDENVEQTIDLLKEIIEQEPNNGEAKAILSSVYGLVMAYSPMKGMLYGSKSSSLVASAMKLEPLSPLVQKLYAGSKLYTPEMFGGNPKEAVLAYEKSITLYEKENIENNWLYLDALVGLSLAYRKIGKNDEAKETLAKALEIEPEYGWAKSILTSMNK